MGLSSKLLEQIAFSTRPKIKEHMLNIMDKSTHEEHLFQPLQTNNKQYKIAIIFYPHIMVFSMLQIQIINFISSNQFQMMIIYKYLFDQVFMK